VKAGLTEFCGTPKFMDLGLSDALVAAHCNTRRGKWRQPCLGSREEGGQGEET
jgi:hypothetical protein